jgi:hypothetical protein
MVRDVLLPLAGTIPPIVLLPLQRIGGGILRSPDCALDLPSLPFGFGFGVTHHLTDRLLDGAPYLHGGAFDTILVHGLLQTFESSTAANVRHTAALPDSPLSMTWAEYQKETNASDVMVHLHYLRNNVRPGQSRSATKITPAASRAHLMAAIVTIIASSA